MTATPNTQTFINRYRALTADELPGKTDSGNPQPILLSTGLAFNDPTSGEQELSFEFFSAVNETFARIDAEVVAFPTNMFDTMDVCIMDQSLFFELAHSQVEDDEAKIVLDHTPYPVYTMVNEALKRGGKHAESVAR